MKEILDIYIKLLVAIISFIAPLLINLLSIFSDGIAIKMRRFKEFEDQTANLLKDEINSEGADVKQLVATNNTVFKKQTDENTKQLNLLDPKKQIKNIFPTFFYSILLIMINRLFADDWCSKQINIDWVNNSILTLSLLGSIFFSVKGVMILRSVVWAIIDVKQEIAQDNEKEKSQSMAEKITSTSEQVNK